MARLYKFVLLVYSKFYSGLFSKRREIFRLLARFFRFCFLKKKTSFDLKVRTYDGSNQAVHPDILFDENFQRYILVYTPYPFGFDCYENPSVMYGKTLSHLKAANPNPISFSEINLPQCHLCDPALVQDDRKFYCFFLDVLNFDNVRKCVFYYSDSDDAIHWSMKKIIKYYSFDGSTKEHVLCPGVIKYGNDFYFYTVHVNVGVGSFLFLSKAESIENFKNDEKCVINNIPEGYYLWHLNICFSNDYSKTHSGDEDEELLGLFLLRKKGEAAVYKTVFAVSRDFHTWDITGELQIPDEIKQVAASVYKGTVIPNTGEVLISYKDKNKFWRMAIIPNKIISLEA